MYGDDLLEVDRDARPGTPRYCLRCDLDAEPGEKICHQCGEILREQAFCPVCEAYWHLLAGTDCPKHEIPLQDRAPDPYPYLPRDEQLEWTTVARFVNVTEAEARRLRLEAEGIPVFVEGERNQNYYGCEAKLQVPRKHVADARILLSQTWTSALSRTTSKTRGRNSPHRAGRTSEEWRKALTGCVSPSRSPRSVCG